MSIWIPGRYEMKKINIEDIVGEEVGKGCKGVRIRWLITKEDGAERFAMRMFDVEPGGHTPLHTHEWEHEVFIYEGKGIVVGEKGEEELKKGDAILMPPHEKHQFRNTGEDLLRFICLIPYLD
jgi:quercetin dioxygenase-like cupin family protein